MYDYRDTWIKKYRGELKDYKKMLGTIPTDEAEELERTILNPANEREISLCAACLRFFDTATKTFKTIREEMYQNNECEYAIDVWEESIDGVLYHHRYGFETKKKYYTTMQKMRPELTDKLSTWIKEELTRVLSEPTTDEEYRFCQKYLEYLSEEVDFKERKDNYLARLEYRKDTLEFLSRIPYKKGLLEVLSNPNTDKELEFCIAYFGFEDDKKQILESFKAGKITPINPEESAVVDKLASITKVLLEDGEMEERLLFLRSPEKTADILYELSILECDYLRLVEAIGNKLGYDFSEEKKANKRLLATPAFSEIYNKYGYARTLIDDLLVFDIDRENKNNKMDKFIRIAECFHSQFITDTYETVTPVHIEEPKVKQKTPQEVQSTSN